MKYQNQVLQLFDSVFGKSRPVEQGKIYPLGGQATLPLQLIDWSQWP